jgi:hypothetical protein
LLFGYKGTRMEWLQLGNILLRSGTIPPKKSTGWSRSILIPLSQSRSVPFTLQPNKKQNHSVPDYQIQNRAAPFLESGMERLRST